MNDQSRLKNFTTKNSKKNGQIDFSKRIYVGPYELAGYYSKLVLGLRNLGLEVNFVKKERHPFVYEVEEHIPFFVTISYGFVQLRSSRKFPSIVRIIGGILAELFWSIWALTAVFRHDTFIFTFGKSLFWKNSDLPILRLLRKKVIMNLGHGSETRPPYLDGSFQGVETDYLEHLNNLRYRTMQTVKVVRRCEKYSTLVIGSPFSTSQFALKNFINIYALGIPTIIPIPDNCEVQPIDDRTKRSGNSEFVRVLHAPSNRKAKGSDIIQAVISELKAEGLKIDYKEIQKASNETVLEAIRNSDLVIDQIYADTPMAGFALEASTNGKAVVVGGYQLDKLVNLLPDGKFPISAICKPNEVKDTVRRLVVSEKERTELGVLAKRRVAELWSHDAVAARYKRLLNNDFPDDWWFCPSDVFYFEGACQSVETSKKQIRDLIKTYGLSALGLDDKPEVLNLILEIIGYSDVDMNQF